METLQLKPVKSQCMDDADLTPLLDTNPIFNDTANEDLLPYFSDVLLSNNDDNTPIDAELEQCLSSVVEKNDQGDRNAFCSADGKEKEVQADAETSKGNAGEMTNKDTTAENTTESEQTLDSREPNRNKTEVDTTSDRQLRALLDVILHGHNEDEYHGVVPTSNPLQIPPVPVSPQSPMRMMSNLPFIPYPLYPPVYQAQFCTPGVSPYCTGLAQVVSPSCSPAESYAATSFRHGRQLPLLPFAPLRTLPQVPFVPSAESRREEEERKHIPDLQRKNKESQEDLDDNSDDSDDDEDVDNADKAADRCRIVTPSKEKTVKSRQKTSTKKEEVILVFAVKEQDVVLGRGGKSIHHAGNVRFRQMIEESLQEYKIASKQRKTTISMSVVRETRRAGGNFLRKCGRESWAIVSEDRARVKAAQRYREALGQLEKAQVQATEECREGAAKEEENQ